MTATLTNSKALELLVIRPVLCYLGVRNNGAANLLLGTMLSEQECAASSEPGDLGLYGITPAMHRTTCLPTRACQPGAQTGQQQ